MTVPAWPAALPLPTLSGGAYSIAPAAGATRTDMEIGPARTRRRSTATPWTVKLQWHLTRFELALFEGWYHGYAAEGAAWFSMTLIAGIGLDTFEIRFLKPYESPARSGEIWTVSAEVEARDPPHLDQDALDVLLDSPDLAALMAEGEAWESFLSIFLPHAPYGWSW